MLKTVNYKITDQQMTEIVRLTNEYSSADLTAVVKDAAMAPVRSLPKGKSIIDISPADLRAVTFADFTTAFQAIQPSVSKQTMLEFCNWHKQTQHIQ